MTLPNCTGSKWENCPYVRPLTLPLLPSASTPSAPPLLPWFKHQIVAHCPTAKACLRDGLCLISQEAYAKLHGMTWGWLCLFAQEVHRKALYGNLTGWLCLIAREAYRMTLPNCTEKLREWLWIACSIYLKTFPIAREANGKAFPICSRKAYYWESFA